MAISAVASVQLGAALSTHLFKALTPAGTVWLRLFFSALIMVVATRPSLRSIPRTILLRTIILGTVTGLLMLMFVEAIARLPLGTASAVEFLGPVSVAGVLSHRRSVLIWPALALSGVIILTEPWVGHPNLSGIGFALGAAACWAAYILLTQRVGAQLEGLQGLAISLTIGLLVAAPFGVRDAIHGLSPMIAIEGLGLAILVPLLPFILDLLSLRKMAIAAFGTLMALEPGIATMMGLIVLSQTPNSLQLLGVGMVIIAGIGAQRIGRRGHGLPMPEQL